MKQHLSVDVPLEQIEAFCRKWGISDLSLFGSVLREDFNPDSDVDVLVRFDPEVKHGLFNLVRMRSELEEIFGRDVDLISRRGVEASRNPSRRKAILDCAMTIYAAASLSISHVYSERCQTCPRLVGRENARRVP